MLRVTLRRTVGTNVEEQVAVLPDSDFEPGRFDDLAAAAREDGWTVTVEREEES